MTQSPLVEFSSGSFAIAPGEGEATNPGVFGRSLAAWRVFVFSEGGVLRRVFGTDTREEDLARAYGAVKAALIARPDVRDVSEERA